MTDEELSAALVRLDSEYYGEFPVVDEHGLHETADICSDRHDVGSDCVCCENDLLVKVVAALRERWLTGEDA